MSISQDDARIFGFERNILVAASAGTGKTHRLTSLYALLCLGLTSMGKSEGVAQERPLRPREILAVTFTVAAAEEMRTRLRSLFQHIESGGPLPRAFDAVIGHRLSQLRSPPSRASLREIARAALRELPAAPIQTIHSAALDRVRSRSVALGLAPTLTLLAEDEARVLYERATLDELDSALTGELSVPARLLLRLSQRPGGPGKVVSDLLGRCIEEDCEPSNLLFTDHEQLARERREALAAACKDNLTGPYAEEASAALGALQAWVGTPEQIAAMVRLFNKRKPTAKHLTPEAEHLHHLLSKDFEPGRNTEERAQHFVAYQALAPRLSAREAGLTSLISNIQRRARQALQRRGALTFAEVLREASRSTGPESETPSTSFQAMLVDEFQDTSKLQTHMLLSQWRQPGGALRPSGLFIVGDRKQAIYGFRGVTTSLFSRTAIALAGRPAAEALALDARDAPRHPVADFVALQGSYRSKAEVLSFVNAFSKADFDGAAEDHPDALRYGPGEELVALRADPTGGQVVVISDTGAPVDDALAKRATPKLRRALAAVALARKVHNEGRPYGDMAILTRSRDAMAHLEFALSHYAVPYVTSGAALFQSREFVDIAAFMELVLDVRSQRALATVLRGPWVGISDDDLFALAQRGGLSAPWLQWDVPVPATGSAEGRDVLQAFANRFRAHRRELLGLPPGMAVRRMIHAFELDLTLAALPRGATQVTHLEFLAEKADDHAGSFAAFARDFCAKVAAQADVAWHVPGKDRGIQISTVHASKGLDFGVVILLGLDAPDATDSPPLAVDFSTKRWAFSHPRTLAGEPTPPPGPRTIRRPDYRSLRALQGTASERPRLTYVAFTRARDELYWITAAQDESKTKGSRATWDRHRDALLQVSSEIPLASLFPTSDIPTRSAGEPPSPALPSPTLARSHRVWSPTSLELLAGCRRRHQLRLVHGLDEPVPSPQLDLFDAERALDAPVLPEAGEADPRSHGSVVHALLEASAPHWGTPGVEAAVADAAHRLGLSLAVEADAKLIAAATAVGKSDWARATSRHPMHRELPFVFTVDPWTTVRGTIDLVIEDEFGLTIVDYKFSPARQDLTKYEFQLSTYAIAVRRIFGDLPVRGGVFFIPSRQAPSFLPGLSPEALTAHEQRLSKLSASYGEALELFPAIPPKRCKALRCGFFAACHSRGDA